MSSSTQDLAIKALNDKFDCGSGVISLHPLGPKDWPHLTATKSTGPSVFDFEKLTLGEIVDCLAEAGLLASPQPKAWAVLREDDDVIYDTEPAARRVLKVLAEDDESGYRLYELREVTDAQ